MKLVSDCGDGHRFDELLAPHDVGGEVTHHEVTHHEPEHVVGVTTTTRVKIGDAETIVHPSAPLVVSLHASAAPLPMTGAPTAGLAAGGLALAIVAVRLRRWLHSA